MQRAELPNDEASILARVIAAEQDDLPVAAAKALLKLHFTQRDRDRMHQLAVKKLAIRLNISLKRAYMRLGPWESLRVLDEGDIGDFFNLATHNPDHDLS